MFINVFDIIRVVSTTNSLILGVSFLHKKDLSFALMSN